MNTRGKSNSQLGNNSPHAQTAPTAPQCTQAPLIPESLDRAFNFDLEDHELAIAQSEYYDIEQFCGVMESISPDTNLSILNLNARSLVRNFSDITAMLSMFPRQLDVIAIEETWLDDALEPLVVMDNYTFLSKPKISRKEGGGLGIYIKEGLKFIERPDLACPDDKRHMFDSMFIEFPREGDGRNIIMGLFYRPPNQNTVKDFTEYINSVTATITKEKKDVVYLGDTNVNLLKCENNRNTADYLDTLLSHGLLPKITVPTRIVHDKGTLIDHLFVKLLDSNDNCIVGTLMSDITDHFMNFCFLDYSTGKTKPQHVSYRPCTDKNISMFNDTLAKRNMTTVYNSNDPNVAYNNLVNIYANTLDEVIPVKTVRFNKYKHKKESWITKGILNSLKESDRLHKNCKKKKKCCYQRTPACQIY